MTPDTPDTPITPARRVLRTIIQVLVAVPVAMAAMAALGVDIDTAVAAWTGGAVILISAAQNGWDQRNTSL
jgi:hypothetical protein